MLLLWKKRSGYTSKGNNWRNYLPCISLGGLLLKERIRSLWAPSGSKFLRLRVAPNFERFQTLERKIPVYKSYLPLQTGCKMFQVYWSHLKKSVIWEILALGKETYFGCGSLRLQDDSAEYNSRAGMQAHVPCLQSRIQITTVEPLIASLLEKYQKHPVKKKPLIWSSGLYVSHRCFTIIWIFPCFFRWFLFPSFTILVELGEIPCFSPLHIPLFALPRIHWWLNYKVNITCYSKCPKILYTNVSDKMPYANSADPDQTCLGSTLFAIPLSIIKK